MAREVKNYWAESSFDFEDQDKEYAEQIVVAVTYKDRSTETIASFNDLDERVTINNLIKHFNEHNN